MKDNLENGMLKFRDEDDGGEIEEPCCHCSECGEPIFGYDKCWVFPKANGESYVLCAECLCDFKKEGYEAEKEIRAHALSWKRRAV